MNTKNVYFCDIYKVASIERHKYSNDQVYLEFVKHALIRAKDIFGVICVKDLNTNEKYYAKVKLKIGTLYVSRNSVKAFNDVTNNEIVNLPKEKIKRIASKYL